MRSHKKMSNHVQMAYDKRKCAVCLKNHTLGLPWWSRGQESACQCSGHRFEPSEDTDSVPPVGSFHMPWSGWACVPQLNLPT